MREYQYPTRVTVTLEFDPSYTAEEIEFRMQNYVAKTPGAKLGHYSLPPWFKANAQAALLGIKSNVATFLGTQAFGCYPGNFEGGEELCLELPIPFTSEKQDAIYQIIEDAEERWGVSIFPSVGWDWKGG